MKFVVNLDHSITKVNDAGSQLLIKSTGEILPIELIAENTNSDIIAVFYAYSVRLILQECRDEVINYEIDGGHTCCLDRELPLPVYLTLYIAK